MKIQGLSRTLAGFFIFGLAKPNLSLLSKCDTLDDTMQPGKIGLYIHELLYNMGGTEAYTVRMAAALAEIYPDSRILFVSECYSPSDYAGDAAFCALLKERYGVEFSAERVGLKTVRAKTPETARGRLDAFLQRKRIQDASRGFDLFFYCSRGYMTFHARRNIAIIHFPMKPQNQAEGSSLPARIVHGRRDSLFVSAYDAYLPNSTFTQGYLEQYWPQISAGKIHLLYPPIAPVHDLGLPKEKLILVCSRIDASKKLELLIDSYRSSPLLHDNYKLAIAGNNASDTVDYWEKICGYSKGGDVLLYPNASWEKIVELYNRAEIFWHCKGFGEDDPYMMEHFGMTTVEAMGAGCVPVVINKGGQAEIVTEGAGFKWDTSRELVECTEELARSPELLVRMSQAARERAAFFYTGAFRERLRGILEKVFSE
ncbi:MAG: glycosyltransferase family 4 protein [Treponema sp.]|nr:glycosyltransferase family 4 protein [Treponema sp.]